MYIGLKLHVNTQRKTMSNNEATKFGDERKIKFDLTSKKSSSNVGSKFLGRTTIKSKTIIEKPSKGTSTTSELGSPWGVLLKPVPHSRKITAIKDDETPAVKLGISNVDFKNGPIKLEASKVKKSELKSVRVVITKPEVCLSCH